MLFIYLFLCLFARYLFRSSASFFSFFFFLQSDWSAPGFYNPHPSPVSCVLFTDPCLDITYVVLIIRAVSYLTCSVDRSFSWRENTFQVSANWLSALENSLGDVKGCRVRWNRFEIDVEFVLHWILWHNMGNSCALRHLKPPPPHPYWLCYLWESKETVFVLLEKYCTHSPKFPLPLLFFKIPLHFLFFFGGTYSNPSFSFYST